MHRHIRHWTDRRWRHWTDSQKRHLTYPHKNRALLVIRYDTGQTYTHVSRHTFTHVTTLDMPSHRQAFILFIKHGHDLTRDTDWHTNTPLDWNTHTILEKHTHASRHLTGPHIDRPSYPSSQTTLDIASYPPSHTSWTVSYPFYTRHWTDASLLLSIMKKLIYTLTCLHIISNGLSHLYYQHAIAWFS